MIAVTGNGSSLVQMCLLEHHHVCFATTSTTFLSVVLQSYSTSGSFRASFHDFSQWNSICASHAKQRNPTHISPAIMLITRHAKLPFHNITLNANSLLLQYFAYSPSDYTVMVHGTDGLFKGFLRKTSTLLSSLLRIRFFFLAKFLMTNRKELLDIIGNGNEKY